MLINCDQCDSLCHCMGGALEHLLSSKSIMGLAAPPDESVPIEHLTEDELFLRAMADREKRAAEDPMRVRSMDNSTPWSDYVVSSRSSGKTYRVAIRGHRHEDVYCTCPDYRTNGLGTCKHILHVQSKLKQRFNQSQLATPYKRKHLSLRLHHGIVGGPDDDGGDFGLRFNLPHDADDKLRELIGDGHARSMTDGVAVMQLIESLETAGVELQIYPDAEQYIQRQLLQDHLLTVTQPIRKDPASHSLRTELLNAELLPYQLDGIAFAVGAGRAILADDMGLGKTIQGIGIAELLKREVEISRVLVICPASLKNQWRSEVTRFSGRSVQLVMGTAEERHQ
ncbi:MAG: SNF2-related protein, partial [Planctomycetota bacterium]